MYTDRQVSQLNDAVNILLENLDDAGENLDAEGNPRADIQGIRRIQKRLHLSPMKRS